MRAIKMKIEQIKETITIVKDYPIKGIVFKDITTLLENPDAFKSTVDIMVDKVKHLDFNRVVGVESRGFFWSGPIAYALSCLLYTSPSPRDQRGSRMPSSA